MQHIKKIAVIGGESTGKTTLCEQLATHYNALFVAEFAREYLHIKEGKYTQEDLYQIAIGQIEYEKKQMQKANSFLFCDTTLQVIQVWSEFKYNCCENKLLNLIATQNYDAYILTSPDITWEFDVLRENPTDNERQLFFNWYKEIIVATEKPFCIVNGNREERLQQATLFLNGHK